MTAKEYFQEEISGEPLCEEWIIYHLIEFAKIKCKEQKIICETYINEYQAEHELYPDIKNAPFPKL